MQPHQRISEFWYPIRLSPAVSIHISGAQLCMFSHYCILRMYMEGDCSLTTASWGCVWKATALSLLHLEDTCVWKAIVLSLLHLEDVYGRRLFSHYCILRMCMEDDCSLTSASWGCVRKTTVLSLLHFEDVNGRTLFSHFITLRNKIKTHSLFIHACDFNAEGVASAIASKANEKTCVSQRIALVYRQVFETISDDTQ